MGSSMKAHPAPREHAGPGNELAGIIAQLQGNENRRRALDAADVRLRARAATAVLTEHHAALEDAVELTGIRRDATAAEKIRALAGNDNLALNQWVETVLASEISAALAISELHARGMIKESVELLSHRRKTFTALERGAISYQSARIILGHCEALQPPLPPSRPVPATAEQPRCYTEQIATIAQHLEESRDRMEEALLAFAPGHTDSQLRAKGRTLRECLNPASLADRHEQAMATRHLRIDYCGEGMAEVRLRTSAALGRAIADRVEHIARLLDKDLPASWCAGQLRADIAVELLLGTGTKSAWENIHADIMVVMPHQVLTGAPGDTPWYGQPTPAPADLTIGTAVGEPLLEGPAQLCGFGSVDSDTARRLAAHAKTWGRLFATPDGLALTGMARERYRPTRAQRRLLKLRDGQCTHPTCHRWALNEVDHIREFQDGGSTDLENLRPGCRLHHLMKTLGLWDVRANPDGSLRHCSPAGISYFSWPERPLEFVGRKKLPSRVLPQGCAAAEVMPPPRRPRVRRTPRIKRAAGEVPISRDPEAAVPVVDPWWSTGHDARTPGPAF